MPEALRGLSGRLGWPGKANAALGVAGCPVSYLMTLAGTGIRAPPGAVLGSAADGGLARARKLLPLLDETVLVLMGRGCGAGCSRGSGVAAAKAQFLVR